MDIINKKIFIKKEKVINGHFCLPNLRSAVLEQLGEDEVPTRLIIVKSNNQGYECEIDVAKNSDIKGDIFSYIPRRLENADDFNVALMIPTGIGCELGGHAGDANVLARAFAAICDNLITHPNVVNAANYNEMNMDNTLYVEGSTFTQLFMGQIGLKKVRKNNILLLMDKHEDPRFNDEIVNAASTARLMLGIECSVRTMSKAITSKFNWSETGRASGMITNLEFLFEEVEQNMDRHDAVALSTRVVMPIENHDIYFRTNEMTVNPMGGIEAMLTHTISRRFYIPCAHAPLMSKEEWHKLFGIIDPRKSAESNSLADIYCVLKGLHKSPRIVGRDYGLSHEDISCLVIPAKCVGLPVLAAFDQGIPVIAVKENNNIMQNDFNDYPFKNKTLFTVNNYWEALGVAQLLREGIDPHTVRRPVTQTTTL